MRETIRISYIKAKCTDCGGCVLVFGEGHWERQSEYHTLSLNVLIVGVVCWYLVLGI
jgi:hypothetical protein